jgi:hypothetical protein
MNGHLNHKHELILESLLSGSLPHTIRWNDVVELIGKLGKVEPHGGNEFAFVVGSQREFFRRPSTQELEPDEVARLRKLLRGAALGNSASKPARPVRMAVAVDHHLARVFQGLGGSQPQGEDAVRPYDPHGFHRHLIHRKEAHYQGERVPEDITFYEEIAKELIPAEEIVLIGEGTGKSSAMEFLAEYLKKHHPTIFQRVIATEIADLSALTEPELEGMAKKYI